MIPHQLRPLRQSVLVYVLFLLVVLFVQHPYRTGGFADDDFTWTQMLAGIRSGKPGWSFADYFLNDVEHVYPLFKCVYAGMWLSFGKEGAYWHLMTAGFHAANATLLTFLLRSAHLSWPASLASGFLFAHLSLGAKDSPFLWRCMTFLTMGLFAYLVALLTYDSFRRNRLSPILVSVFIAATMLVWNHLLLFCAPLLLMMLMHYLFPENPPRRTRSAVTLASLTPALLAGIFMVALTGIAYLNAPPRPPTQKNISDLLLLVTSSLAEVLSLRSPGSLAGLLSVALAGMILVASIRSKRARWACALLACPCFLMLVEIAAAREVTMVEKRYLYFGCLAWSVGVGLGLDLLLSFLPKTMWAPALAVLVAYGGYSTIQQYQMALRGRQQMAEKWDAGLQAAELMRATIEKMAATSKRPLVLPDIPIGGSHYYHPLFESGVYWSMGNYVASFHPYGLRNVSIVSLDQMSATQLEEGKEALENSTHPGATVWLQGLEEVEPSLRLLLALEGEAAKKGIDVILPDASVRLDFVDATNSLAGMLRFAFSHRLTHLKVSDPKENDDQAKRLVRAAIEGSSGSGNKLRLALMRAQRTEP